MKASQKFREFFTPKAREEYSPIIACRNTIHDSIIDISSLIVYLPADKRQDLTRVINWMAEQYQVLDEINTTYMQMTEDERP